MRKIELRGYDEVVELLQELDERRGLPRLETSAILTHGHSRSATLLTDFLLACTTALGLDVDTLEVLAYALQWCVSG